MLLGNSWSVEDSPQAMLLVIYVAPNGFPVGISKGEKHKHSTPKTKRPFTRSTTEAHPTLTA